jgi:chromosome segregation ATPase
MTQGGNVVDDSILDIESGIDKIEALIKTIRNERDKAKAEADSLKKTLDDHELELLQFDEELQKEKQKYAEKLAEEKKAREEIESRLAEVASKVKNLLPLVSEFGAEDSSHPSVKSSEDRT